MRHRITRLGRWHQRISATTKLVRELVRFVESLTLLTNKLSRLVCAVAGLTLSVGMLVSALR